MLESTFRCPGVGASREREIWARGIRRWDELPASGEVLGDSIDVRLRAAVDELRQLLALGDVGGLARLLPVGERWRLWPRFESATCFLDVESDGGDLTAVSVFDAAGVHAFVRGVNMAALPERLTRSAMLVTFNGASFDVPALRAAFPDMELPRAHVDLRGVWRRLGWSGGLKALEKAEGLTRPSSIEGCDGAAAVRLWRDWDERGNTASLRTLVEYNLYDAIQLRSLIDIAYNRLAERAGTGALPIKVFERGDVTYDVSKILLTLP